MIWILEEMGNEEEKEERGMAFGVTLQQRRKDAGARRRIDKEARQILVRPIQKVQTTKNISG